MSADYEFLERVVLSIVIGAMIGLEREYSMKQRILGLRSFALVAFMGSVSVLTSSSAILGLPIQFNLPYLPYLGFIMVAVYSFLAFNSWAKRSDRPGITTILALPLTYLFGMLVGYGLFLPAVASAVIVTLLLYSRRYSHVFVEHLTEAELADALRFAIVLCLAYPFLPAEPLTFLDVHFALKRFVEMVVVFSLVSFSGFLALRLIGQKALPYAGFFAGFVSALSVAVSYAGISRKRGAAPGFLAGGIFAAAAASLLSDLFLLAYASPALLGKLAPAAVAMAAILGAAALVLSRAKGAKPPVKLTQPFSVINAAKFALAFFAVTVGLQMLAGLGNVAIVFVAFIGGLASVTPIVASAAIQAGGTLSYPLAAQTIVAAILGGMLSKSLAVASAASPGLRRLVLPVFALAVIAGAAAFLLTQ